ncbi:hypothetical protein J6590_086606, partial [Homalodisca vitripennis]
QTEGEQRSITSITQHGRCQRHRADSESDLEPDRDPETLAISCEWIEPEGGESQLFLP